MINFFYLSQMKFISQKHLHPTVTDLDDAEYFYEKSRKKHVVLCGYTLQKSVAFLVDTLIFWSGYFS